MINDFMKLPGKIIKFIIVLFLVMASSQIRAQVNKFDLRLLQDSVDCTSGKVFFEAQIRATSAANQFIMGSSNLVFTYSNSVLSNPALVSANNYSGGRYSQLGLTFSGNTVSLNIVYQGSPPYTDVANVTTDWKSIALISFDIAALSDGCYNLNWNSTLDFPGTVLSEVIIAAGTYTEVPVVDGVYTNASGCAAISPAIATLSGDTTILAGGQANLKVNFTGSTPVSVFLGGNTYPNLTSSPFQIPVTPSSTTTYTLDSVSNGCGKGTVQGNATVTINNLGITTNNLNTTIVCPGSTVPVSYTSTGTFGGGNTFKVQLSDASGANFADITSTGTGSPLTATIPAGTPAGTGYRVRVVSTNPVVEGTPSAAFAVSAPATAVLSGGGTIPSGGSVSLNVQLTGLPPWSVTLSDNSTSNSSVNQIAISKSPAQTTTYTLLSMTDACGSGTVQGSATVTIQPDVPGCKPTCAPVTFTIIRR